MSTPSPTRTLVAVDGSRDSMAAAREVANRPWPPQSLVRILYVNEHGPEQFDATSRSDESVHTAVRGGKGPPEPPDPGDVAHVQAWRRKGHP